MSKNCMETMAAMNHGIVLERDSLDVEVSLNYQAQIMMTKYIIVQFATSIIVLNAIKLIQILINTVWLM